MAGIVSFISPCVLPIVPGYLSFISGINVSKFKNQETPKDQARRVAITSLFFVLGFSTVFVLLGAAATMVGYYLQQYKRLLGMVGGMVIIVLGMHMMGIFRIKWLLGEMEFRDLGQFVTDGFTVRRSLARDYDALVWIDEVTPVDFSLSPGMALFETRRR